MRSTLVAGLLVALGVVPAAGQAPDSLVRVLRGTLRMIATVQEPYWAQHQAYGDLAALNYAPEPGVTVQLSASAAGWSGRARHEQWSGGDCVYYLGDVEVPRTAGGVGVSWGGPSAMVIKCSRFQGRTRRAGQH